MKILVDTHLLLQSTIEPYKLSSQARVLLEDLSNDLFFSSASIWEIAIKVRKPGTNVHEDPRIIRDFLLTMGYREIAITSAHAMAAGALPLIHQDPFDRILLAQAIGENCSLMTGDSKLKRYTGPILRV